MSLVFVLFGASQVFSKECPGSEISVDKKVEEHSSEKGKTACELRNLPACFYDNRLSNDKYFKDLKIAFSKLSEAFTASSKSNGITSQIDKRGNLSPHAQLRKVFGKGAETYDQYFEDLTYFEKVDKEKEGDHHVKWSRYPYEKDKTRISIKSPIHEYMAASGDTSKETQDKIFKGMSEFSRKHSCARGVSIRKVNISRSLNVTDILDQKDERGRINHKNHLANSRMVALHRKSGDKLFGMYHTCKGGNITECRRRGSETYKKFLNNNFEKVKSILDTKKQSLMRKHSKMAVHCPDITKSNIRARVQNLSKCAKPKVCKARVKYKFKANKTAINTKKLERNKDYQAFKKCIDKFLSEGYDFSSKRGAIVVKASSSRLNNDYIESGGICPTDFKEMSKQRANSAVGAIKELLGTKVTEDSTGKDRSAELFVTDYAGANGDGSSGICPYTKDENGNRVLRTDPEFNRVKDKLEDNQYVEFSAKFSKKKCDSSLSTNKLSTVNLNVPCFTIGFECKAPEHVGSAETATEKRKRLNVVSDPNDFKHL